jgi:hypothetical protein
MLPLHFKTKTKLCNLSPSSWMEYFRKAPLKKLLQYWVSLHTSPKTAMWFRRLLWSRSVWPDWSKFRPLGKMFTMGSFF